MTEINNITMQRRYTTQKILNLVIKKKLALTSSCNVVISFTLLKKVGK